MTRQNQVLLHFVQLSAVDGGHWIFLSVNCFLLKRCVQLREWQRSWVCAQCFDPVNIDRVWNDAQFQTINVCYFVDGALAVGHVTEAQFIVAQTNQTFFFQLGMHFLTECAIYHGISFLAAGKHKREIEYREVFDLAGKNTRVHGCHFQSATLNG